MNPKLNDILKKEKQRQWDTLDLIPSENYTSKAVREAVGSVLMHKYSEGYPRERYYEGNENIDELEELCRNLVLKVMLENHGLNPDEWHANVQVLSGSVANLAVYNSVLKPGDTILSMYLPDGGHLSHGWSYEPVDKTRLRRQGLKDLPTGRQVKDQRVEDDSNERETTDAESRFKGDDRVYFGGSRKVSFISKLYNIVQYKTDPETEVFDYGFIEQLAAEIRPKLIITGGTAYPREIDYERMKKIADSAGAFYHADVAHEAGLIAGGVVDSPFEFADFVTFTTHKTLRGPKGAVAMCRKEFAKKLDRSVFPGLQGGPFNHQIAGIAQCFLEADTDEFRDYAAQVVKNAKILAEELVNHGFHVLSSGTDKHLVLCEVAESKSINGAYLARALAICGIIANKNTVPGEKGSPKKPTGIRFGTPTLTTRGMKEEEIKIVAGLIDQVAKEAAKFTDSSLEGFEESLSDSDVMRSVSEKVQELCQRFVFEG